MPPPPPSPLPAPLPRAASVPAARGLRPAVWLPPALLAATAWTLAVNPWLMGRLAAADALPSLAEVARAAVDPHVLREGARYAAAVLAVLGAHEMGHYLACRVYRIPATLPFFLPGIPPFGTFGALIRVRGIVPHRRALFDVAAAGPLAGFVVALGALVAGAVPVDEPSPFGRSLLVQAVAGRLPEGTFPGLDAVGVAGWFGMLVTSLNLFPVGQLDGGHAAYAVSRRLHRHVSRWTVVAMILFVAWETVAGPGSSPYVLWTGILVLMRQRHPRLADERTPLGPGRIAVACVLAAIFVLTFLPFPLHF